MLSYRSRKVFDALLSGLNVDTQTMFDCGCRSHWANARDHNSRQRVAEIGCVEKPGEVFDCRRACERDAVTTACKHRSQLSAIEILRQHGLIRWDDIDARTGLFQRFWQYVAPDRRARQQNIKTPKVFGAASEFAERDEYPFGR
jgi:hypothetical protein